MFTSAVMLGQYQVSCSQLAVRSAPEWVSVCVSHSMIYLVGNEHSVHHLGLLCRATRISITPSSRIRMEFLCECSFLSSVLCSSSHSQINQVGLNSNSPVDSSNRVGTAGFLYCALSRCRESFVLNPRNCGRLLCRCPFACGFQHGGVRGCSPVTLGCFENRGTLSRYSDFMLTPCTYSWSHPNLLGSD